MDQEQFLLQKQPVNMSVAIPRGVLPHFAVGPSQRSSRCLKRDCGSFRAKRMRSIGTAAGPQTMASHVTFPSGRAFGSRERSKATPERVGLVG